MSGYYVEIPMPEVRGGCMVCRVKPEEIEAGHVLVSPTGIAHHSNGYDRTACGKDATGAQWWWPL